VRTDAADNNMIGGTAAGMGNRIIGSGFDGVLVLGDATGNQIRSNAISKNGGLGINLQFNFEAPPPVTPNDVGDVDTGPNNQQNFPVLTLATRSGGNTIVKGMFNSKSKTSFQLDFFASTKRDPSGFGEGEKFLGSGIVTTNSSGNAAISAILPTSVPDGQFITATATDPDGNTSEFSQSIRVGTTASTSVASSAPEASVSTASADVATGLIRLRFSKALDASVATDASHYQVQVNGVPEVIEGASYEDSTNTVTLVLAEDSLLSGDQVMVFWEALMDKQGEPFSGQAGPITAR
jgi:hypothetical protein